MVRLGIYVDVRNPSAWHRPWHEVYGRTLEEVVDAERRGADAIWLTEHHLFDDGYLSQPFTVAAAIAARTSRVRIGTAVYLPALRPAIQVAEEIAIVDVLSGGRIEAGFGAGYRIPEFDAFGAGFSERFTVTDGRIDEIRALWQDGAVVPPPVQGDLPFWLGYRGASGARRAGRRGVGLLSLDRRLHQPYIDGLLEGGRGIEDARMGGLVGVFVAEDIERAWAEVMPYLKHHVSAYRRYAVEGTGRTRPLKPVDDEMARSGGGIAGAFDVLTPEEAVTSVLDKINGLPVTDLFFWNTLAGMTGDVVDEHRRLLLDEVFPKLRVAESG